MNSLEKLLDRLRNTSSEAASIYAPSHQEMEGVVICLRNIAELAQHGDDGTAQHVLASPARMLGYTVTDELAKTIAFQITEVPDAYSQAIWRNAMEWADMVDNGKLSKDYPADLFEPLLTLLERGCHIRLNKGFFEVGDKAIPIHKWPALSIA